MYKRTIFSVIVLSFFLASPALFAKKADDSVCKVATVAGSYVRVKQANYSGVDRTFLLQLNLSSDGIALQNFTGGLDLIDYYGGESNDIGSWECREDGKLLVTMYRAEYPAISTDPFTAGPIQAAELRRHFLVSYLFIVTSADTLTTVEIGLKEFDMSEDPTDPAAGILRNPDLNEYEYNRVKPTDAYLTQ